MSRKQIGFGILVALIVALFAVLISVFQLNAEVCFTLFALAAPIYLVGRLVESKRLELAGLGSAIVAFGMSGWMDEFDTIPDVLTFGQIVTAVLLGLAVAAGIYLAMRKLGYRYFADDDDSVGGIFDDLMSGNVDDNDDASSALREYDDERDPYKRYGGQLTKDETRRLISFAEPSWDYDVINEALRKRNGIFRSKKPPMGTVSPSMLANSRYIADKQINEGAYAAPDETKLIVTMSPSGGVGKALPNDFAIPCYDGDRVTMATVGDISVGDSVVGSDGKPTMVLGVYPQGELETYEMAFEDGTTVPCSSNHIWTVIGDDGTRRDMTTGEMLEAGVTDADGNAIWRIPVASPIDGIAVDDGDARRCVDDVKVGRSIRLDVISCSQRQRKAVLDAVEEAYGVERDGLDVTVGVPSDMIDAVRTLACSLGMRCFVGDGAEDGVTLAYLRHVDSLAITGIRDLGRKSEMTCLYVKADDHLFCVGDDFTLTHNTTVATMNTK